MTEHAAHLEQACAFNKGREQGRQSVKLTYHKASTKRVVKRKVDPLAVKGHLLVAYDHKRKALRSFHLDRIKHMEKNAFWDGFKKAGSAAAELAGLGMLAVPSIQHLRGKPFKDSTTHKMELAGLGTLAAPYVGQIGKKLLRKGK